eukprot:9503215-Pyramimonas_sp.AAC.1
MGNPGMCVCFFVCSWAPLPSAMWRMEPFGGIAAGSGVLSAVYTGRLPEGSSRLRQVGHTVPEKHSERRRERPHTGGRRQASGGIIPKSPRSSILLPPPPPPPPPP